MPGFPRERRNGAPSSRWPTRPVIPTATRRLFEAAPDDSIWLFWPTILDHRWEAHPPSSPAASIPPALQGCLEMVADKPYVTPKGFADEMKRRRSPGSGAGGPKARRSATPQERGRPLPRDEALPAAGLDAASASGRPGRRGGWILPSCCTDTFSASIMGDSLTIAEVTWTASKALIRVRQTSSPAWCARMSRERARRVHARQRSAPERFG